MAQSSAEQPLRNSTSRVLNNMLSRQVILAIVIIHLAAYLSGSLSLFKPKRVGTMLLQHRVVMAPMSRYRASDAHVPSMLAKEYYIQRADTPGSLIITEGTYISEKAGGQRNAPGVWSDDQIAAWREARFCILPGRAMLT
jgi:hypothetical protein